MSLVLAHVLEQYLLQSGRCLPPQEPYGGYALDLVDGLTVHVLHVGDELQLIASPGSAPASPVRYAVDEVNDADDDLDDDDPLPDAPDDSGDHPSTGVDSIPATCRVDPSLPSLVQRLTPIDSGLVKLTLACPIRSTSVESLASWLVEFRRLYEAWEILLAQEEQDTPNPASAPLLAPDLCA